MASYLLKFVRLARMKHYIKNGLILLPAFAGRRLFEPHALQHVVYGVAAFSFLSSAIYIYNDLCDVESDRAHPVKCRRPIASGEVGFSAARIFLAVCLILSTAAQSAIVPVHWKAWGLLGAYTILNLAYSKLLKRVAILDMLALVAFYLLRLYYGAVITDTPVSPWLYLTVLMAASFLGFGKRRNEIRRSGQPENMPQSYTFLFLDKMMYVCLGATIVFYSLWCQIFAAVQKSDFVLFSIPLVLATVMRYSLLAESGDHADPMEVVMRDRGLLLLIGAYALLMAGTLYF